MDSELKVGDTAPGFNLTAVGGRFGLGAPLSMRELKGETVILYFYPKDDTPGCTTQACGLRDQWTAISQKAAVFGVSPDSPESHRKFIDKFELPFPLISDVDKELARAYGVWVEKSMYGKKYMGVERSTFIIDAEGKIQTIYRKVKPAEHLEQLLRYLE